MADAGYGEIESLTAQVEALDRLADFAALAAHELLKPLVLAHTCAAPLIEGDHGALDDATLAELELMMPSCSYGRALADTLLADAQYCDAAMGAEPVDLTLVVRECIAMLAADLEARRMRVELSELPVVAANAVLLTAVSRNLLVNAIEHGSGRRREIRVFAERDDARWRIAVDSPGPPISEDDHTALFEVPWRGAGRRGARGGCGLVLVRGIVERQGARSGSGRPTTERTGSSSRCPPRARVRHVRRVHAEPPRRPRPASARRACGRYA